MIALIGWKRALTTYRYLRAQGLPAIAPIDEGPEIYLCVGAEPKLDGPLADIRMRLKTLPGPPPQNQPGAFASAFFKNIDDIVERD